MPNDSANDRRLEAIERTLERMAQNMEKLTALETRHIETRDALGRAFDRLDEQDARIRDIQMAIPALTKIDDHETRLRNVEVEMPTLKLIRGWVIAGVTGVFGILGVAIISLVVVLNKAPAYNPAAPQQQQR